MEYKGTERRQVTPMCERHDAVVHNAKAVAESLAVLKDGQERIEESVSVMMERQLAYVAQTARLETIVTNGLSHNVEAIRTKLETVCGDFQARICDLEKFSWFRTWVTSMRDDLFKNMLRIVLVIGGLYVIVHFGNQIIAAVVK